MSRFTSKRTYSIVVLSVLFFLSISFYSNKDFYKQYIIDKIYSTIEFKIEFEESSLTFFPLPGIKLNRVTISNGEGENKLKAEINTIEFLFSWQILIGTIELTNINIKGGKIELFAINLTNSEPNINKPQMYDTKKIQKIFTFLNLDQITLESIELKYQKENLVTEELFFNFLAVNSDHKSLVSLDFNLNYKGGNFKSETKFEYIKDNYSFESIEIKSKCIFKNFALKPFKEYYGLINGANFSNTFVNGDFFLLKERFKNEYNVKTNIDINNLFFVGDPIYPIISASSELVYFTETKQIQFITLNVLYENGAVASANGSLTFAKDILLNLNIKGEYADIYKVIYLLVRFSDFNNKSDLNFYSHLNILAQRAVFDPYEFKRVNIEIDINNTTILFKIHNADILDGHISGKGKVTASQHSLYDVDIFLKDIKSEDLIRKYTQNLYVKGQLSSNFNFTSSGNTLEFFLQNLQCNGKLEIKRGELLGYANILKPIFSLGKIVNILGPRGKNTEFQSLSLDYNIHSKNITITNLKMLGVGIDAHGAGTINFERKIDFRIYAGLGGLAGKALYIPILYKGTMPDNVSYIDPVWIGSVYVGATLFAGPAGATVGGVAGSAVSEYVQKAWEGIKGIFSSESKKD